MAGYDEDFWGEDFLEGEEGATEGEETEVVETEETAEDSAAEDSGAEDEGIGTETDGGDPGSTAEEGQEFSPDLLARIEAETQKRVDARIAREFEGILNPYTNQPIRTEADLTAYRSAFAAEEQRQQLEEMGVSKEVLDSYIQNHPAMQQAQQVIHQQEQQAANDFMAKEFEAMKKEFPDCGLESPQQLNETEAGRQARLADVGERTRHYACGCLRGNAQKRAEQKAERSGKAGCHERDEQQGTPAPDEGEQRKGGRAGRDCGRI